MSTPSQTCIGCANWNLRTSPLRAAGFGQCKADPNEALRAGRTFSGTNVCRMGKFEAAKAVTVERRRKEFAC